MKNDFNNDMKLHYGDDEYDENEDLSGGSENDLQTCSVGKDLRDTLPSFENPLKTTKGRSTSPSLLAPSHKLLPPLNNIVQVDMLFIV